MKKTSFLIITGASGSGKSIVLKELEDIGYYAVDNLPVDLLHSFAHLVETGHADITRAAMVMDIREIGIPQRFPEVHPVAMAITPEKALGSATLNRRIQQQEKLLMLNCWGNVARQQ